MGEPKQTSLAGTLTKMDEAAEYTAELRTAYEDAKIRYEKAADNLFAMMLKEGVMQTSAGGLLFKVEESEPKLKVKKGAV